jgi:hypothetical protein
MPAGLMELMARKDKRLQSRTTLELIISTATVMRNYYFATAELFINGINWQPQLRTGSQIKTSLTRSADQVSVELQNADTELGIEFLSLGQLIYGASAKVGRYWKDLESGAEYHKVLLTGVVVGLQVDENVTRLTAVSEPYAQVSVGASRRVAPSCQWTFRDPTTCGFNGSQLICNFLLNHADGCEGRHGTPLKFAKFGGMAFLNSSSRLKTL